MSTKHQITSFRDLDVWKTATDMVVETYGAVARLPRSELYELSGQMRRSAVSVPSNIAEGHARRGRAYANHGRLALGSTAELDTQIELALRLGLLATTDVAMLIQLNTRVAQMLQKLSQSLNRERWIALSSFAFLTCASCAALFNTLR